MKCSSENSSIVIKEDKQNTWDFEKSYEGTIIIYLPEYMEQIDEVKMNIGAGTVSIEKLNIKADVTGKSKIDTGVGNLDLYLTLSEEDYKIDIDKGIGEIKFNDNTIGDNTSIGGGSNYIKINGGVGDINISTE